MTQLAFRWPEFSQYNTQDFILSSANEEAARFIDGWPTSPHEHTALLTGPPACGKTHLAHCWAKRTGAVFIDSTRVGTEPSQQLWQSTSFAICDNTETITNEAALFHLLRHAETSGGHLLLTSALHPALLPFTLPDLRSRFAAMPGAAIQKPDDVLLQAFFAKAFADRQWRVSPQVLHYMVARTERSFLAAQQLMQKLEQVIASTGRELTIPLVKPLVE